MIAAVAVACGLLLAGVVLRATLAPLRWLYVPASVVGGTLGLVAIQALVRTGPERVATATGEIAGTLRGWPGVLIAVVFAGLLLEHPGRKAANAAQSAVLQGIMVWIIVVGQVALGLAATWLLIEPWFDVPPVFGQLIEAGFAGGHGTAAALGAVYAAEPFAWTDGLDLALTSATVGLVYSVISGIFFVNVAVRRGWTRAGAHDGGGSRRSPRTELRPVAFGRLRGEIVDPLAFQVLVVAAAIAAGWALQWTFVAGARALDWGDTSRSVENVPLFLFTLIGGWLVRRTMTACGVGDLLDGESIKRIVAIAMEFLIVAAIASLRIEVVAAYGGPLAILFGVAFAWTGVCLVVLAPRLLPAAYWFELGIINYGMSTGTTAQGLMLLRIVDEDLESGAAEDYALAAPMSAPFVGGGVLTLALPLLLLKLPVAAIVGGLVVLLAALGFAGHGLKRRVDGVGPGPPDSR